MLFFQKLRVFIIFSESSFSKMRILFLGEPLANAVHWMKALEEKGGAEVLNWHLTGKNRVQRIAQWFLGVFTIRRISRKYAPDIIIGYRTTSYGFLAALSGIKPCVIAAQGETDVWPPGHWTAPLKAFLVRFAVKRSDLIHAWGPNIAQTLIGYGAAPKQLLILPRGVDTKRFSYKPEKPTGSTRMVTTRSLFPEYHHNLILRALARVKKSGISFQYTIIGKGILWAELHQLIQSLDLSNEVEMIGNISNENLPPYLHQSHLYVAMPETEGVSASLFEAMACGCFPVVSDLPANQLLIKHEQNGLFVPVMDEDALVRALILACQNVQLRNEAIQYNRALIEENADLEKNIRTFMERYQELTVKVCAE